MMTATQVEAASLRPLFDAIMAVESGGNPDAVGDNGASIGPYQIQRSYWRDSRTPGHYEQVKDRRYAELVMVNYWSRYCPHALADGNFEWLARTHNGGPAAMRTPRNKGYWRKVQKELRRVHR